MMLNLRKFLIMFKCKLCLYKINTKIHDKKDTYFIMLLVDTYHYGSGGTSMPRRHLPSTLSIPTLGWCLTPPTTYLPRHQRQRQRSQARRVRHRRHNHSADYLSLQGQDRHHFMLKNIAALHLRLLQNH